MKILFNFNLKVKDKNTKENLKEEEDNQIDGCYVELNDLKNEVRIFLEK